MRNIVYDDLFFNRTLGWVVSMSFENLKDNWGVLLWGIGFLALGIFSFMYPDAADMEMVRGRRSLVKLAVVWLWGWPLGIIATIFGILACIGAFAPRVDDD